jgi:hypothetical protein
MLYLYSFTKCGGSQQGSKDNFKQRAVTNLCPFQFILSTGEITGEVV